VIISEGEVVAEDTPANLTARMKGGERVLLELEGDEKLVNDVFNSFSDVTAFKVNKTAGGILKVEVESEKDLRKDYAQALIGKKIGLLEMHSDKITLEDIFLHLTTKEEAA
jgi:ABC-2 type transport system ATP-binding protein